MADLGPTAPLLWTLPTFRESLFLHLHPRQLTRALTWSRISYSQVVRIKYREIRMMRYRRYQPRFLDPRRSILFHSAPRVLDCRDYVPVLNDPESLSFYLTLFPNVKEVFDNDYRLSFSRSGAEFRNVRLELLRLRTAGEDRQMPRGIPQEWEVEVVTRSVDRVI